MTQLGNLLTGQKSVSFKIIQGQITRTVFLTQAFRDLEFVILLTCIVGNVRFIICIYIYIYICCKLSKIIVCLIFQVCVFCPHLDRMSTLVKQLTFWKKG